MSSAPGSSIPSASPPFSAALTSSISNVPARLRSLSPFSCSASSSLSSSLSLPFFVTLLLALAYLPSASAASSNPEQVSYSTSSISPSYDTAASTSDFSSSSSSSVHNESSGPSSKPDILHLSVLVLEAVFEVVCVSLPGYIIARQGMFDAEAQKFIANLNVQLFTPCLVFTKLASQLTLGKLVDLAIIPFIFCIQTCVSFFVAYFVSGLFGFKKRPRNFVIAMGVFGNSNSLPISLVVSLSSTLKGLHWERLPNDTDSDVAARGILYLLIFQQLGQLVRWSWGYHVLLAPPEAYSREEGGCREDSMIERGEYMDGVEEPLLVFSDEDDSTETTNVYKPESGKPPATPVSNSDYGSGSGSVTPVDQPDIYYYDMMDDDDDYLESRTPTTQAPSRIPSRAVSSAHLRDYSDSHITSFPNPESQKPGLQGLKGKALYAIYVAKFRMARIWQGMRRASSKVFKCLPSPMQKGLKATMRGLGRFFSGVMAFMNPPLWAMLIAIVVASVPELKSVFFTPGTFVENSVTRAVKQSAGVAVPLILVVLGANLARNTLPKEDDLYTLDGHKLSAFEAFEGEEDENPDLGPSHRQRYMEAQAAIERQERNLLIASLLSRMLLPTLIMAPIIALVAKFVPVSILDDPIFVIVCFLLTGAPSALQLAQICQINNVYMKVMSSLLFQSYVVWILPSTLMLVMSALAVLEWSK